MRKNCSSDRENLSKFETEGRELLGIRNMQENLENVFGYFFYRCDLTKFLSRENFVFPERFVSFRF